MTAASARPVGREGRVGVHKVALQCRERRVRVWKNAQHAFSALGSRLLLDRRAYRGAVVHHIAHGARAATGGAAMGTPRKCFSPNGSAPRAAAAVPHGTQPAESQGEDWPETPPPPGVSSVRRSRRREGIFARPLSISLSWVGFETGHPVLGTSTVRAVVTSQERAPDPIVREPVVSWRAPSSGALAASLAGATA